MGPVAAMKMSLGAAPVEGGGGVQLLVRPPLCLDSTLPMPLRVTFISGHSLLTRSALHHHPVHSHRCRCSIFQGVLHAFTACVRLPCSMSPHA